MDGSRLLRQTGKRESRMHRTDQYQPNGPTTGPMRPLIVVMETTDGHEKDSRSEQGTPQQQQDAEQDRLLPVSQEEEEQSTTPAPTPPPREPRPLSLPVVPAPRQRSFPLLVAGTLGISIILLGVAFGLLLATNPSSLGPMIAWLPGITPTASVTLTPAQQSQHISVPITAVTGTPDPTRAQVSARLLSVTSHLFTQTVPATGHGHTQARQDVEAVVGPESTALTQQAQTSLQGDVRPNEQLASPAQCHPTLHTDHLIGSEATRVTITLFVTCQAEVYDEQAVQQLASAALGKQAHKSLGIGYNVQGTIKTTVTQIATTEAAYGTLSLLVSVQGTWSYQFSSDEIAQFSKRIVGLSRQQAIHLLKQDGHIQTVSIAETWNATSIPTDPSHIQVLVLDVVGG
jgi:VCBS repeat-containing protein